MLFRLACPITERAFVSEVDVDEPVLRVFWRREISCSCPACGGDHSYDFTEHYFAAVEQATPKPPSLQQDRTILAA